MKQFIVAGMLLRFLAILSTVLLGEIVLVSATKGNLVPEEHQDPK